MMKSSSCFTRCTGILAFASIQLFAVFAASGHRSLAASDSPAPSFVRISRAFFEKPLQAQVQLSAPQGSPSDSKNFSSAVQWVQYPPTSPAPQQSDPELGQVLADFRDFVACAEMTSLGESRLCFKVMADVSNLGVNDNEMTLRGVETIAPDAFPGTCSSQTESSSGANSTDQSDAPKKTAADGGAPSRYKVQKATVSSNSLQLEFKHSDGCGPNVQLTLTQAS
jgi:hypothetical protein